MTDWKRMVEPQADGYDASEIVAMATARGFVRSLPQPPLIFGASLRVLDFTPKISRLVASDVDVSGAEDILAAWPEGRAQCAALLTAVYSCRDPLIGSGMFGGSYGTKTNLMADFGQVYATTNSLVGFVEGVVSSVANWKLYTVGIMLDSWSNALLTNATDERYQLPLRDEQHPIGAVLHSTYACMYMLDLYVHLRAAGRDTSEVRSRLTLFHDRVERGTNVLLTAAKKTAAGSDMFQALQGYADRLLRASA